MSPAHLVVGLVGGEVYRFNVITKTADLLVNLGANATGFSHDSFTGQVHAGLATLELVAFIPSPGR